MISKHTTGLILAGGRGSRMGHVDKGWMPFRGTSLVAQVLRRLVPQVAMLAISANRNLERYAALGVPVWPDALGGFEGPLSGVQTALSACKTAYLLTVPCDTPFLPADLLERLGAALAEQHADLAFAATMEADADGHLRKQQHPVIALMKASVLPTLTAYLQAGGRRVGGWHSELKVAEVLFPQASDFSNVNTLEQLHALESRGAEPGVAQACRAVTGDDADGLRVADAQQIIADVVQQVTLAEHVALRSALDRVLAEDILSPIDVPAYDNSAMDGYALRSADLPATGTARLIIVGTTYAGRPYVGGVSAGQCVRIMTGGLMPRDCDSVVPQELIADAGADAIVLHAGAIAAGANRRLRGEDLAAGGPALQRGRIVRPADLGLLASLGIAEVAVRRRLRVAFFSTGDELRSIGEPLDEGCVYDSNRYTLFGMLSRLGCDVIDLGVVKDQRADLDAALRAACEVADVVLTSGGVSAGAADYTRQVIAELGEVAFWKLNMRPGRPMAFGKISANGRSAYLFGLPGNPVAVMVSFYFLARPALLRMMGADSTLPMLRVAAGEAIRKKAGRAEYQRGIVARDGDGQIRVRLTGAQGSGILRSMAHANCMVVLDEQQGPISVGEMVDVLLFEGLV